MRVAAIDIGTNSLHMIVVRIRPDLSFEIIDREKEMVRLGAGGLDGRRLTPEAVRAALQVLSKFGRLTEAHRVDETVAVATSAIREAENGGDFLQAAAEQTGIRARIISGTEEARLIHLAACYGVDVADATAVVIDIGGGSVEITRGAGPRMETGQSFKLGVIRLTEHYVASDPLSPRDVRKIVKRIDADAGGYLAHVTAAGFDRVIGTSGTIMSLGAVVAADADGGQADGSLRNRRIAAKALRRVRTEIVSSTLEQRLRIPGLDPRRADLAPAGAVLLDTLLQRLGADDITLCGYSLREGLVLDYIARHATQIAQVDRYPDVRRRSVMELAERCRYSPEHAAQVAALALSLFDQTRDVHGLDDRQREWLEYAALLHDIGVHVSYDGHHKHSYYLITNGELRGFEPDEIETIALVARYHRRGTPSRKHAGYADLGRARRRVVRTLAAVLRLSESLDRSHARTVDGVALDTSGDDDAVLRLETSGDAELEVWAAARHAAPFERLIGRPLRFEVTGHTHAEHPDKPPRVPGEAFRRRRHRRLGQDDAARAADEVAERRRASRVRHRVELVRAGEGGDQDRQEEERPDADDVQPAARDRLR
jgi:exopolyphosphatase / guanosine-5'-triphosphate,3'-diphosphate pyrophosphatase